MHLNNSNNNNTPVRRNFQTGKESAASSSSGGGGGIVRSISSLKGDRLSLVILAMMVLLVFWSGVAIGFGFSHAHDHNDHHIELLLRNRKVKQNENEFPTPVTEEEKTNMIKERIESELPLKGASCCNNDTPLCKACKDAVPLKQYCLEHSNEYNGCENFVLPAIIFDSTTQAGQSKVRPIDADTIGITAYISTSYLAPSDIMTVVSNRIAGCENKEEGNGYALFINEWQTNDGSVRLNFLSDSATGCVEVASPRGVIVPNRWYHIAAVLKNDKEKNVNKASIYVDGKLVVSKESPGLRKLAKLDAPFNLGIHSDGKFQYYGKMTNIAIYSSISANVEGYFFSNDFKAPLPKSESDRLEALFLTKDGKKPISKDLSGKGNDLKFNVGSSGGGAVEDRFEYLVPMGKIEDVIMGIWPDHSFTDEALLEKSNALGMQRREVVKQAMIHSYGSYEKHAFGQDEVLPKSGLGRNNWQGMAVTMVDSLDTLWVMGMKDEFYRARDYCRDVLRFDTPRGTISVFETNIRVLGGLLSAFDLSKDPVFLKRAQELGDRLMNAFQTNSGMPVNTISLTSGGGHDSSGNAVLAEVGTLQLEFRSLSFHTKDPKYARAAERVHTLLRESKPSNGLYPMYVDIRSGHASYGPITFGAMADSFYEYLLKIWIQGGRTEKEYLQDYEDAMDGMHAVVVQRSSPNGLTFLADVQSGNVNRKMDHLACFVPGLLALGSKKRLTVNKEKRERDMRVAKALMYTCFQMYQRMPTGLSAEYVTFGGKNDFDVPQGAPFYILRPETVESLFILNKITGHPVYRDWGHQIMLSLNKYSKTAYGYGAHPDVRYTDRTPDDRMESFFLAETLKYLYLLQDPLNEVNLDDFVFNTE